MRVCTSAYTHAPLGTFLHIQVTGNMTSVVRGLDRAMQTMDLERVREHTLDFFFFLAKIMYPNTSQDICRHGQI